LRESGLTLAEILRGHFPRPVTIDRYLYPCAGENATRACRCEVVFQEQQGSRRAGSSGFPAWGLLETLRIWPTLRIPVHPCWTSLVGMVRTGWEKINARAGDAGLRDPVRALMFAGAGMAHGLRENRGEVSAGFLCGDGGASTLKFNGICGAERRMWVMTGAMGQGPAGNRSVGVERTTTAGPFVVAGIRRACSTWTALPVCHRAQGLPTRRSCPLLGPLQIDQGRGGDTGGCSMFGAERGRRTGSIIGRALAWWPGQGSTSQKKNAW